MQQDLAGIACEIRQHFEFAPCQRQVDSVHPSATRAIFDCTAEIRNTVTIFLAPDRLASIITMF
jgi:hypothetical protein